MNILKYFVLLIILLSFTHSKAQTLVDVTETTLKIPGLSDELIYFGFAKGDKMIINFKELKNKGITEFEISEWNGASKFTDFKLKELQNKEILVPNTGIYRIRLSNNSIGGRICKMRIQRIPACDSLNDFNTSVFWSTRQDTSYTPVEKKFLIKSDTNAIEIYSANPQVSSQTAINGNANYQIVDFTLPTNTVYWSFFIGTGTEAQSALKIAQENFMKSIGSTTSIVKNPLIELALHGTSYFVKVQGEDNVKYWFLSDATSVQNFRNGNTFYQYKKGDVVNEASRMLSPLSGKVYLALMNDNSFEPISLTVKAVAIVVDEEWETRVIQEIKVVEVEEPYLKN